MTNSSRRIHVDSGKCEGHALCVDIAPEIFTLDDDEISHCVPNLPEALWPKVESAIDACPRQAISLAPPADD